MRDNLPQVGMIPAQTQLQTALAINMGTEGKAVSRGIFVFSLQSRFSQTSVVCCFNRARFPYRRAQVFYGFGDEKLVKMIDEVKVEDNWKWLG